MSIVARKSPGRAARRMLRRVYAVKWRLFPPNYSRIYRLRVNGLNITVLPTVFHPTWHFTSEFLAAECRNIRGLRGARVLELGTGTGVVALSAARYASRVVAVDISESAVRCARLNAAANGLDGKVEVRSGDMFAPVRGEQYDIVLCNPPYFRGTPANDIERAYFGGPQLEWLTRFASGAHEVLPSEGRLITIFGDAAEVPALVQLIEEQGWHGRVIAKKLKLTEQLTIWEFTPRHGGKRAHDSTV